MREFTVHITDEEIDEVRHRLRTARWPSLVGTDDDWDRGMPAEAVREAARYWAEEFDWRETEKTVNSFPQLMVPVSGTEVHVVHLPSPRTDAIPLVLVHGWPSSFMEFLPIARELAQPTDPSAQAFHVVVPSIPGYGFSPHPDTPGWDTRRVAQAFVEVMAALNYRHYLVHGGDWGSPIALRMAEAAPGDVRGVHLSMLATFPPDGPASVAALSPDDQAKVNFALEFEQVASGWRKIQSTRPHTLSYGLHDSPVGQLAWICEKFREWSAPGLVLDRCGVPLEFQVATAALYWFTGTASTSAELYFESNRTDADFVATWGGPWAVSAPVGVLELGQDVVRPVREWAGPLLPTLRSWRVLPDVGHFPALEAPDALVTELRTFATETSPAVALDTHGHTTTPPSHEKTRQQAV
ncbi:epoxide hydrolase family protein [Nocardia sp. 004]|uniref:epoxide hydrolase family protein n=1 Tax=Nocardia sp. 004 TaxID=3385978 RepID=UPI0039A2418B